MKEGERRCGKLWLLYTSWLQLKWSNHSLLVSSLKGSKRPSIGQKTLARVLHIMTSHWSPGSVLVL